MVELEYVFGDPEVCTGCMVCVNVCSMYYSKVIGPQRARVRAVRVEPGLDFPLFCRNCDDAPCISSCPENALSRTSKGVVIVNNRKCQAHGECVKACPYDAIAIHPDTNKAIKCIQCGQCVERCPPNAIWTTTDRDFAKRDTDGRISSLYEKHKSELYSKEGSQ